MRGPYRTGRLRREQIIEAAVRIFGETGYLGSSLRQVAELVGVTPAGLLRHFEDKEALLTAVLDRWTEMTDELTHSDEDGLAAVVALGRVMPYHVEHPGLLQVFITLAGEASGNSHPARRYFEARYAELVERYTGHLMLAGQRGEVVPMTMARAETEIRLLFAVMDGIELQWLLDRSLDLVGLYNAYLGVTMTGWQAGS